MSCLQYTPNWERLTTSSGYKVVHCPDHPSAWKPTGYVFVHRIVAEQKLGRLLRDDEVVHHINGNKHDNRPENLEVLSNAAHARHHASETPQRMVPLFCANCGKEFYRRKGNEPAVKGYSRAYCSRQCNGTFQRRVQLQAVCQ